MADYNEEQVGRLLRDLLSRRNRRSDRPNCPDEEGLANYLSGALAEETRDKLEEHLVDCSFCLSEVVATYKAAQEVGAQAVPQWVVQKAMGLVESTKKVNVFDLAVRFIKDSLELVSTSGQLVLAPAPFAIRGEPKFQQTSIVRVEDSIGENKIVVEVEQVKPGLAQAIVEVRGNTGEPLDGSRVTLVLDDREVASYLTRQGQAVFENVAQGEYNLVISKAGINLGTIRLKIEGEL
jgi:hypothetical protein